MLGAIIGDTVGSVYEFHNTRTKNFKLFTDRSEPTDDSIMTLAVADVVLSGDTSYDNVVKTLRKWGNEYPYAGYGGMFANWLRTRLPEPYNSCGDGAAMRISPVGWVAKSEEEVVKLSRAVTEVTHNHPEGIKGAEAVAMCIYLARKGFSKEQIKERMVKEYYPEIKDLSFEELKKTYEFSEICQKSVPQAIYCFLISNGLEDAIRNCVAIGGDCDTTGAMAGAIAEAYYKNEKSKEFIEYFSYYFIDPDVGKLVKDFHDLIGR